MNCVADPVADDGSESDEAPAPVRKCTGKGSEAWKILTAMDGTLETAQEALSDILQIHSDLSSTRISSQSESLALGSWIMATYGIASTCENTVQPSPARIDVPRDANLRSGISTRITYCQYIRWVSTRTRMRSGRAD